MTQTTADTTTEAIDLYREVHKGLRKALFDLAERAGTLSTQCATDRTNDVEFAELFTQVDMMLSTHHSHEDSDVLKRLISEHAATSVGSIEVAHERSEQSLTTLRGLVAERESGAPNGAEIYDATVAFTADYLAHMSVEENQVMPALQEHASHDDLFEIQMNIRGSVPPPDMCVFLSYMLPAMNPDERVAMLGGMKMGAPPEIFEMFWGAADDCLSAPELAAIADQIGA